MMHTALFSVYFSGKKNTKQQGTSIVHASSIAAIHKKRSPCHSLVENFRIWDASTKGRHSCNRLEVKTKVTRSKSFFSFCVPSQPSQSQLCSKTDKICVCKIIGSVYFSEFEKLFKEYKRLWSKKKYVNTVHFYYNQKKKK